MFSYDEQLQHEIKADAAAQAHALKEYAEALQSGDIDKLPKARALLGRLYADVKESIATCQATPAGRAGPIRKWLNQIEPGVAAVISIRVVLRALLADAERTPTFQMLASRIGEAFEQEVLINQAYAKNPVYVERTLSNIKAANTKSPKHIKRTMDAVCSNVLKGQHDSVLDSVETIQLGKLGLQACIDAGLCEPLRLKSRKGDLVVFKLTDDIEEFLLLSQKDASFVTDRAQITMLAPPKPWEGIAGGGYYSDRRRAMYPLINTTSRRVRKDFRSTYRSLLKTECMPVVYSVANYLQAEPFTISTTVRGHIERIWQQGGNVLGIPSVNFKERPPCPFPEDWDKATATEYELDQFNRWKRSVANWHTERHANMSKIRDCATFLRLSRELQGRPIWHPVYLDSRSRLYYHGTPNPQGSDVSRAVLHFYRKKALGRRGVFWLKVHIANSLGYDKVSMQDRVEYVDSIWDALLVGSAAPEDSDLYRNADAPFSALAAVLELDAAYRSGNPETYETGFVVHMDATCSGLQHFSALLRDPVGGRYVNLIDAGCREDVYARVANAVKTALEAAGDDLIAKEWLGIGLDRKVAKKPVMTYVYGATFGTVRDNLLDYLIESGWSHPEITTGQMTGYLARVMLRAIEDTVPAAAEAMRWLRSSVKLAKKDTPVVWKTPLGFPVYQDPRVNERIRVEVRSCGLRVVVVARSTDKTNGIKMANSIAPNLVHSLDATHLYLTAERMRQDGLSMVTIHDSFGTHPADVDRLLSHTKQAFIDLYSNPNLLDNYLDDIGVTMDKPTLGNLDITLVKDSEFFFS